MGESIDGLAVRLKSENEFDVLAVLGCFDGEDIFKTVDWLKLTPN